LAYIVSALAGGMAVSPRAALLAALLACVAACTPIPPPASQFSAQVAASTTKAGPTVPVDALPGAALDPAAVAAELSWLRTAFAAEVPAKLDTAHDRDAERIALAHATLAAHRQGIEAPQLLLLVDRNPTVQEASILLARPGGGWAVIGGTRVSTGQAGRKGYFLTPLGAFPHTDAILDWRAEGTLNENGIRGLGVRGMRVWDFGWQEATKGWREDGERGQIRLLVHATDPDVLEQRLGRPASQGCIRVPAAMNHFLDRHGVLDADVERAALDDVRYRNLLLPDREPTPLAGRLLVVVDSAEAS
jgi:hypothetical protein